MAFLFKSKKQEREKARERDAGGSQGSVQRVNTGSLKDEKASLQRSTPTGSLNSLDTDGHSASPEQGYSRRTANVDQQPPQQQSMQQQQPAQQQSDLPVSSTNPPTPVLLPRSSNRPPCELVPECTTCVYPTVEPERIALPMVPAPVTLHVIAPKPIPSIWRRC